MNQRPRVLAVLAASLALLPAAVSAKVVFTGYGDFQLTPQSRFRLDGAPASLASLNTGAGTIESRSAVIDSLGLFATTNISDQTRMAMDVTYRDIGAAVRTIRVQYAYVEHESAWGEGRAGRITVPFGWYNQSRFYPFSRPAVSAPLFQSGILGLPMADLGASLGRRFELGPVAVRLDVYGVNGYGNVTGASTTFRAGSLPGGLVIANNLPSRNSNNRMSLGGRVDAGPAGREGTSIGASYYRGEWDPEGRRLLQLAGAHVRAEAAGFYFLAEGLHMDVRGDQGMLASFGGENWRTDGGFALLEYQKLEVMGKAVTPWLRGESYTSRASRGGPREALWSGAAGAALQAHEGLWLKLQGTRLYYRIPLQGGDVSIDGYQLLSAVTVSF